MSFSNVHLLLFQVRRTKEEGSDKVPNGSPDRLHVTLRGGIRCWERERKKHLISNRYISRERRVKEKRERELSAWKMDVTRPLLLYIYIFSPFLHAPSRISFFLKCRPDGREKGRGSPKKKKKKTKIRPLRMFGPRWDRSKSAGLERWTRFRSSHYPVRSSERKYF